MNPNLELTPEGWYVAKNDTHLSQWVREHKTLEVAKDFLEQFRKYIPEGGTVLDIGACLGDHTITYSKMVGPNGTVYAFEPNYDAFEALQYNTLKYQPAFMDGGNVICCNWALGREAGAAGLKRCHNLGLTMIDSGDEVDMETIDSLFSDLPFAYPVRDIDFIKIDAEGYEPFILEGGEKTIQRCRPVMLVEVNRPMLAHYGRSAEGLVKQIEELGYTVQPCEPHLKFSDDQIDVLCLPKP